MNIGTALKTLREQCGYTPRSVAEFLEISENRLHEIENGRINITENILYRLCSLYGVFEDKLIKENGDLKPLIPSCSAADLQAEDLRVVSSINRIALNQDFMTGLLEQK